MSLSCGLVPGFRPEPTSSELDHFSLPPSYYDQLYVHRQVTKIFTDRVMPEMEKVRSLKQLTGSASLIKIIKFYSDQTLTQDQRPLLGFPTNLDLRNRRK